LKHGAAACCSMAPALFSGALQYEGLQGAGNEQCSLVIQDVWCRLVVPLCTCRQLSTFGIWSALRMVCTSVLHLMALDSEPAPPLSRGRERRRLTSSDGDTRSRTGREMRLRVEGVVRAKRNNEVDQRRHAARRKHSSGSGTDHSNRGRKLTRAFSCFVA